MSFKASGRRFSFQGAAIPGTTGIPKPRGPARTGHAFPRATEARMIAVLGSMAGILIALL